MDGSDGEIPAVPAGPLVSGRFASRLRGGRTTGWALSLPPHLHGRAVADLPLVVVLHGRGAGHATAFRRSGLGLGHVQAALVADGVAPFALASVDGGDTYWHRRADGTDSGAMVLEELLPRLAGRGLGIRRIGVVGWSMGAFGGLHLALIAPQRVRAVGAMSPAIFESFGAATPGSFDDAADLARTTVLGRQDELSDTPLRVVCGLGDRFLGASRRFVDGFADPPPHSFELGDHDTGYWRRVVPGQLRFVVDALT